MSVFANESMRQSAVGVIGVAEVDVAMKSAVGGGKPSYLIDVREADEFSDVRATGAVNLPLSAIERGERPETAKDAKIFLMCLSGKRSAAAATVLRGAGYTAVANIDGGIKAWLAASLPVARG